VITGLAPAWAAFFYWQADFLLAPFWGPLTLLLALVGAPALAVLQERRTGSTVLTVHVWIGIYGLILVAALFQQHGDVLEAVTLGGQILLLAALSLWGQLRATLSGALTFAALLGAVWLVTALNGHGGLWAAVLLLAAWWLLARRRFWIPWSAWLLALAGVSLSVLVHQNMLDQTAALIVYLGALGVLLFLAWRRRK
jgi:hypothetical protein